MLRGVRRFGNGAITHSVVMRSKSGTVRYIEAHHNFATKTWAAAWYMDGGARMHAGDAVLGGFGASLTGRRWVWRAAEDRLGLASPSGWALPEILGRLLAARGIDAGGGGAIFWTRRCARCCRIRRC